MFEMLRRVDGDSHPRPSPPCRDDADETRGGSSTLPLLPGITGPEEVNRHGESGDSSP